MVATALLAILAGLYLVLGVMGLFLPKVSRRLIAVFVHRTSTRYLGIVSLMVGTLTFRYSYATLFPLFAKALSFAIFVLGGAQLLIPDLVIVFNEWWGIKSLWLERALGLVYIALAAFFLVSVVPSPYTASISTRLKPTPERNVQSPSSPSPQKQASPHQPGVQKPLQPKPAEGKPSP